MFKLKRLIFKKSVVTILIILCIVVTAIPIIGNRLDRKSEHLVSTLYSRNEEGIIKGTDAIHHQKNHKQALIFIHGFLETPEVFRDLIKNLKQTNKFDLYAPLLPYHGRNLQSATQLSNKDITAYIKNYINKITPHYNHVTIVGFSYGASQLIKLTQTNNFPQNLTLILAAPAIYIQENTLIGNAKLYLYSLFRRYCNYKFLGCDFPVYDSGDQYAKSFLKNEINLRYKVIPALKELYRLDDELKNYFPRMSIPFILTMAKDDNRVSYTHLSKACVKNPCCRLVSFPSGRHMLHHSKYKKDFLSLVIDESNTNLSCTKL